MQEGGASSRFGAGREEATPAAQEAAPTELSDAERLEKHLEDTRGGAIVPVRQPEMPTLEEDNRHMVDHCPYASWCRACVAGRGKATSHYQLDHGEDAIASVHCDYCFMGES